MGKNNIKAILFDADGVVLKKRDKYFSQRLFEDYGLDIPPEKILKFFKNEYKLCVIGKADLKTEVEKYMKEWGWQGTVDELLEYWFSYENKLEERVLEVVRDLREKGIKCYLASDHSRFREDNLMKEVGMEKYFDGAFFSCDLGYTKAEEEYYEKIIEDLNLEPAQIMFWDDEEGNVEIAKTMGIKAMFYKDFAEFVKEMQHLGILS